jgi:hypothetical protein
MLSDEHALPFELSNGDVKLLHKFEQILDPVQPQ